MMRGKRGLVFLYTLMLGMCIILFGIFSAYPTKQIIDDRMAEMNCTAPANDFDQGTCWFLDILKPTVPGLIIFVGFGIITAKVWTG